MKPQIGYVKEPFDAAREKFEEIVDELCSPAALEMAHGELETLISTEGMELLRQLLQSHLDFRGIGEVGTEVAGTDGVVRTHRRRCRFGQATAANPGVPDPKTQGLCLCNRPEK